MRHRDSERTRPPHFSREQMLSLDEADLYESEGLMGQKADGTPDVYHFENIRNPLTGVFEPDFPVDWVDWNKSFGNDVNPVKATVNNACHHWLDQPDPTKPAVNRWFNKATGDIGTSEDICYDVLEGGDDLKALADADMRDYIAGNNGSLQVWAATLVQPAGWPYSAPIPAETHLEVEWE